MNATTDNNIKRQTDWLKYINTFILSVIAIFTIVSFNILSSVQKENTQTKIELVRLKTVQDENTLKILALQGRVSQIELNNMSELKTWVDNNYVRKAQK